MITCLYCARACAPSGRFCDSCGKLLSAAKTPAKKRLSRPRVHFDDSWIALIKGGTLIGVVVLLFCVAVRLRMNLGSSNQHKSIFSVKTVEAEASSASPEALRAKLLGYIAERNNSGVDFEEHLLGNARLESYKPDEQEVFFSLPAGQNAAAPDQQEISRFIIDPASIEIAREENGMLQVGNLSLEKRADRVLLFRTSVANVKFDPEAMLSFKFERGIYTVSLREAVDYMTNRNAQGGNVRVNSGEQRNGRTLIFANHGTFVARRGEPSLVRLVETLLRDIPDSLPNAREKKIQRLLDFVSNEITYDDEEAKSNDEVLKHPVEILISRHGDCSNKAILFGSLLEQINEDYLFLYCHEHITVAVEPGRFPKDRTPPGGLEGKLKGNSLAFNWEKKNWLIAEATASGFQIGVSYLRGEEMFANVEFVQRPHQKNVIYDARTGRPAEFR